MDDWRLTGQQRYLHGAALARRRYRARSATWDHDHCAFCWAKFVDPGVSQPHGRLAEEQPDVVTQGYATTAEHPQGADYHWVCERCFDDFADLFEWRVVEGDSA